MPRRKQSRGVCAYCEREFTKGGMNSHLRACPRRMKAVSETDAVRANSTELHHLRILDYYDRDFWLHLEVNCLATLDDLDHYLRAIWLECCGHLSLFSVAGWGTDEIPSELTVGQVFSPGLELTHIYDFGTSNYTLIKALDIHDGKPTTSNPVVLMARNNPPDRTCTYCGQPAAEWCMECVFEHDAPGTLCELHAQSHPHHDYGDTLPIMNSPRLGSCGYDGPAEPPY